MSLPERLLFINQVWPSKQEATRVRSSLRSHPARGRTPPLEGRGWSLAKRLVFNYLGLQILGRALWKICEYLWFILDCHNG